MKSFWEKASDFGSIAKSFASEYLGAEIRFVNEAEEQGKNNNEIPKQPVTWKEELNYENTNKATEEIIKSAFSMQNVDSEEKKIIGQKLFELEVLYASKEKAYLANISALEKNIIEKDSVINNHVKHIAELTEQINKCNYAYLNYISIFNILHI